MTLELVAPSGEPLPPGEGEVLRVYATVDWYAPVGQANVIDTITGGSYPCEATTPGLTFGPAVNTGLLSTIYLPRGDTKGDRPLAFVAADVNGDGSLGMTDLTVLINHMFLNGPPPPPY